MSIFEIGMLVCFGCAWPVSIWKSFHSRQNAGKSLPFLLIVCIGYVSGAIHKVLYSFDPVIWLYIGNGIMVFIDIMLYIRNNRIIKQRVTADKKE